MSLQTDCATLIHKLRRPAQYFFMLEDREGLMEAQAISDKAIKKKILSMVIPITAENILQMTAGLVSMAMVGRLSAVAVGAIGLSNVIFRLIWEVFKGISIGTTILVAQSYGARNMRKLARVSVQGILL